jgi:hypothetical protein
MSATTSRDLARRAIVISFIATTAVGCAFVFWTWAARGRATDGLLRCVTLVCAMVAVHAWGLQAYRNQAGTASESFDRFARNIGRNVAWFRRTHNVGLTLVAQTMLLLVGSITLDGGMLLAMSTAGIGIYWLLVLIELCTRTDA